MTDEHTIHIRTLDAAIRDLRKLREHMIQAQEDQWERPGRGDKLEDAGIRSANDVSDPTTAVALNEARLKLRAVTKANNDHVSSLAQAAWRMEAAMADAIRPYVRSSS